MQWSQKYHVGIAVIDEQHRELFEMVEALEKCRDAGSAYKVMRCVLKKLVRYVKEHFENEEQIMRRMAYPDLPRHKKLHKGLVEQVVAILLEIKEGKVIAPDELRDFLRSWLVEHIMVEDKRVGEFLCAKVRAKAAA